MIADTFQVLCVGVSILLLYGLSYVSLALELHTPRDTGELTSLATLVRLLTINSVNAYITSWVLYLSGGSEDPRLLLPAWISIATTLTFLYHVTHPRLAILKETSLSISVFSIASFISMVSLLLQLHLSRENDPPIRLFLIARQCWEYIKIGIGMVGMVGRDL
ncbi:hypothetical protein LOCC1_G004091 [Lachnellula occidentalis]|uniref:Uncharacterized protein n=1 Tax=Lachnellula occidentalis TaxID=215460 RepID=A0A8H8RR77_9HELO|nr:hypothetical protein LOCC1_G004091 [Lachnellula occidentalis]